MAGLVGLLSLLGQAAGEEDGSLSEMEIKLQEAQLASEALFNENERLRHEVSRLRERQVALAESLAGANSEAQFFREQLMQTSLRLEALGLGTVGGDQEALERRLLEAVRDLRILSEKNQELSQEMVGLSEAVLRFLKSAVSADPEARMHLEERLRRMNVALGVLPPSVMEARAASPSLTDGMVISISGELALVVANLGSQHGVEVGMPFQVLRGDAFLGTVRVVDVREKISGAVIQQMGAEGTEIQVGDRVRVDARPQ